MGKRPDLPKEFRSEVRTALAYLTESEGFSEPEDDGLGLVFRRGGLAVRLWYHDGLEPTVSTGLLSVDPDGTPGRKHVWLDDLYTALGCGPPQDVPFSAFTRRAMLKRVHAHAAALRRVLPLLDGEIPEV
ncbi:hypothetical protein ACIRBZ_18510 [Streptomyces sp. NPDC094038]|uniref:hypothetical protein n=1 Tax=Streptomyces sp. NPDC094038 TaxID=3366055 RepID=UPI00380956F6